MKNSGIFPSNLVTFIVMFSCTNVQGQMYKCKSEVLDITIFCENTLLPIKTPGISCFETSLQKIFYKIIPLKLLLKIYEKASVNLLVKY